MNLLKPKTLAILFAVIFVAIWMSNNVDMIEDYVG